MTTIQQAVQAASAVSAIPPAVISRIKIEIRSHLLSRGNLTNGALLGGVIAKALQDFPESGFSVRQYGGMSRFVERFLSDTLRFHSLGGGGDPIFEGIDSSPPTLAGLWRPFTHPKSEVVIVLDQHFNLHVVPNTDLLPGEWKRISPVSLALQYEWATEFVATRMPAEHRQSSSDLLKRYTSENFTFEWIAYLKRNSTEGLSTIWSKFRTEKIQEYFAQQLKDVGCPPEKVELYNAQLFNQQIISRNAPLLGAVKPVSGSVNKERNQPIGSLGLIKQLAHAYVDSAGEKELRDLKINLGAVVDAISRLDLNNTNMS
ncbi:hypothetical protein [Herbaspirillum robiniae]|uniref:Uncharacterized protein n=1 Tax=Herbaspirillum robiniae TaxID=2014887 RepID=A0ABX2M6R2_9BURK|nr:hypothetical protein [Herbaspirillum robiniae]NUU03519.1 hypothetical protein [Herbaspirillum robiniae]